MPVVSRENITMHVDQLQPYPKNARTHSDYQIKQLADFIKSVGYIDPIIIDETDMILAGHGRALAALRADINSVPCVRISGLTESEKRAYVIADNKLALNAGWDDDLLKSELDDLMTIGDIDISILGFSDNELELLTVDFEASRNNGDYSEEGEDSEDDSENIYTNKIKSPVYKPTGEKPELSDLFNITKTSELIEAIKNSDISDAEKEFLKLAAYRHIVFNYETIAEYYAHATKQVQEFFENSALVIIDINKAIENGFVILSKEISEVYTNEKFEE